VVTGKCRADAARDPRRRDHFEPAGEPAGDPGDLDTSARSGGKRDVGVSAIGPAGEALRIAR
jgi:hypothetical protein